MAIERRTVVYDGPGGRFEGLAATDPAWGRPRPGVLILPNVLGPKEADFVKAEQVAALGYAAFVADLFGQANRATRQDEKPSRFMDALNADRVLLRDRLHRSLEVMRAMAEVDAARLAAIGFCFGGKCVLDLARSGAPILGGVSFHGVYDPPGYANVTPMRVKLLLCHGWNDPLAPPGAVEALARELTEGGADWQLHAYGHAGHGFTDRSANMPERGVIYDEKADRRSWAAMQDFLAELFPPSAHAG